MRIVFADDHDAVRKGVRAILADAFEDLVIDEAKNGKEAIDLALAKSTRPGNSRYKHAGDGWIQRCQKAAEGLVGRSHFVFYYALRH